MRLIDKMIDRIDDELEGAKKYGEMYIEEKAKGNIAKANTYKEMAHDELKHATYLHEMAVKAIEEVRQYYTPPVAMLEAWEKSHAEFVERTAWVKQMLSM
jgi:hypothetical protein